MCSIALFLDVTADDTDASVATFVATLVFMLDTAYFEIFGRGIKSH
jgi:hypothetical protein